MTRKSISNYEEYCFKFKMILYSNKLNLEIKFDFDTF